MMDQQHVFRRDGGVRLELEHPMAVVALAVEQRLGGAADRRFDGNGVVDLVHMSWAALCPDRTAPSMVAGSPVAVQSPASSRLPHFVRAAGRLASCSGKAAKVARRSLTICHAGTGAFIFKAADTSRHRSAISASRSMSTSRSAPLIVIAMRSGKANIHSTVPPMTPSIAGVPGGGAILKCALTMERNSSGALRPGSNSCA